jgi:hypothetical protein
VDVGTKKILACMMKNSFAAPRDPLLMQIQIYENSQLVSDRKSCPGSFCPWFPCIVKVSAYSRESWPYLTSKNIPHGGDQLLEFFMDLPLKYLRVLLYGKYLPKVAAERFLSEKIREYNLVISYDQS